jgi:signal transduction histidine kinase
MRQKNLSSPALELPPQRGANLRVPPELLTLLALPGAWSGREPRKILEMLLEALEAILPIDHAYAVVEAHDEGLIELTRVAGAPADHCLDELRKPFRDCLEHSDAATWALEDGELGRLRIVASPFGFRARRGALVLGSRLADFPNENERSILLAATKLVAEAFASVEALRDRDAASRAREEFVATVVHELRHPLGPIVMALDLLKARSGAAPPSQIAVIERHVEHLCRLIDDLSDLSQVAHGELDVRKEVIELIDAVSDGVEEARLLIRERGHDLTLNVPARGLRVLADRTRMAEVVANLLTNAAKYTEPGGQIELSAWREGRIVVLRVRDDGIGIAEELLPHVFDRFVRGGAAVDGGAHAPAGLGIGLAVVKHLVSLHGGTVLARSGGSGRGSEFTVRLPALDRPSGVYSSDGEARRLPR